MMLDGRLVLPHPTTPESVSDTTDSLSLSWSPLSETQSDMVSDAPLLLPALCGEIGELAELRICDKIPGVEGRGDEVDELPDEVDGWWAFRAHILQRLWPQVRMMGSSKNRMHIVHLSSSSIFEGTEI